MTDFVYIIKTNEIECPRLSDNSKNPKRCDMKNCDNVYHFEYTTDYYINKCDDTLINKVIHHDLKEVYPKSELIGMFRLQDTDNYDNIYHSLKQEYNMHHNVITLQERENVSQIILHILQNK